MKTSYKLMLIGLGLIVLTLSTVLVLARMNIDHERWDRRHGNGQVQQETRAIAGVHSVSVPHFIELTLRIGPKPELVVEADENLLPGIITEVENGRLRFRFPNKINSYTAMRASLTLDTLQYIGIHGNAKLRSEGRLPFSYLKLEATSNAEILANLAGQEFRLETHGRAKVKLNGSVNQFFIEASGRSDIQAEMLQAQEIIAQLHGKVRAEVSAVQTLNVEMSGSGEMGYRGDPEIRSRLDGQAKLVPRVPQAYRTDDYPGPNQGLLVGLFSKN